MDQNNRLPYYVIANVWPRPLAPLKFSEKLGGACDETITTIPARV